MKTALGKLKRELDRLGRRETQWLSRRLAEDREAKVNESERTVVSLGSSLALVPAGWKSKDVACERSRAAARKASRRALPRDLETGRTRGVQGDCMKADVMHCVQGDCRATVERRCMRNLQGAAN